MKSLNSPPEDTLYRRLGGYDVIAAVIDEFLSRFRSDPRLARFGGGRSLDSRQRTRQLIVEQICSLAGGPCVYTGRDMKTTHAGLGITEAEWQANLQSRLCCVGRDTESPRRRRQSFWRSFRSTRTISSRSPEAPPRTVCRAASGTASCLLAPRRKDDSLLLSGTDYDVLFKSL